MKRIPAILSAVIVLVLMSIFTAACSVTPPNLPTSPTASPTQPGTIPDTSGSPTAAPSAEPSVTAPAPTETAAPTLTPTPDTGGDLSELNAVTQQIANAVGSRDYTAMRRLMRPRFSIATFNQSLYEYTSEEALNQMRQTVFAAGSEPVIDQTTDVVALLGGADPLQQWGPVAQVVRAVHVTTLGPGADVEAVIVIGREPETGKLYWHGILLPQNGHTFENTQPGTDVVRTDVKQIVAKEDVNVRSGPGTQYAVEGMIRQGEIATVAAKTPDGAWWWILCTQDSSGHCWVSADPSLTEPAGQ